MLLRIRTVLPILAILGAAGGAFADPVLITSESALRPFSHDESLDELPSVLESGGIIHSDGEDSTIEMDHGFSSLAGEKVLFGEDPIATPLSFPAASNRALMERLDRQGPFLMPAVLFAKSTGSENALLQNGHGPRPDWAAKNLASEEAAPVPEPSTLLLLGGGLAAAIRRARRSSVKPQVGSRRS